MTDLASPRIHEPLTTLEINPAESQNILTQIPTEIIEKIVEILDVPSILNLRLTCRDLARRTVGPHLLKTCFQLQTTDLSSASLSRLEQIVSYPVFGPAVKQLTFRATVYYSDRLDKTQMQRGTSGSANSSLQADLARYHENLNWLADRRGEQALSEFDEHEAVISQLAGIMKHLGEPEAKTPPALGRGLELMGGVSPGPGIIYSPARSGPPIWNNVACRASQAFYITIQAMVRSGLKTPLLWIYPQTRRCSVPAGTISWLMAAVDHQDLARVMSGIKNFALSFAPAVGTKASFGLLQADADVSDEDRTASNYRQVRPSEPFLTLEEETRLEEDAFVAVPEFIRLVSADVKILDLHMFNPHKKRAPRYSRIFVNLSREVHFPKLEDCALGGIWATEASLVQFLEKHGAQLRRLALRDIWLTEGSWAPIFGLLHPRTFPNLEFLRLESLFCGERSRIVNLCPKTGHGGEPRSTNNFIKNGVDIAGRSRQFLIDLPSNSYFNCTEGKQVFCREWNRELFWLDSRDEEGVPVGLEFSTEDRGFMFPSAQLRDWKMRRADEFGPPPGAEEWQEYQMAMGRSMTDGVILH